MPRIEPLLPIDVRGELNLDMSSGRMLRLYADGSELRLDVPDWQELSVLGPRSFLGRRRAIVSAAQRLSMLGLSLNIDLQGRRFLSLGNDIKPTLLSRVLGLGSVYLSVPALFSQLKPVLLPDKD